MYAPRPRLLQPHQAKTLAFSGPSAVLEPGTESSCGVPSLMLFVLPARKWKKEVGRNDIVVQLAARVDWLALRPETRQRASNRTRELPGELYDLQL